MPDDDTIRDEWDGLEPDERQPFVTPPPDVGGVLDDDAGDDQADYLISPIDGRPPMTPAPDVFGGDLDAGGIPDPPPPRLEARSIGGHFDAFAGVVVKTYYDSEHPTLGTAKGVDVKRCHAQFDADGYVTMTEAPNAASEPTPTVIAALPFPFCDDQPLYHVEVGEPVTILIGDDGRAYYLQDNLPFVGIVVQNPDDASTKEANFGGAGNRFIKVRRVLVEGDPSDGSQAFHATKIADTTYSYVKPLVVQGQHHGQRKGSHVLVHRRGLYFYCAPRDMPYIGEVVATGPNSEADFENYRYWVQVYAPAVAYSGDNNTWDFDGAGTVLFTVCAANTVEYPAATHLIDSSADPAVMVVVHLLADEEEDESPTKAPFWIFSHAPNTENFLFETDDPTGIPVTGEFDDVTHMFVVGDFTDNDDGKTVPRFVFDPGKVVGDYTQANWSTIFCADASYYPNGWTAEDGKSELSADYDITPAAGTTTHYIKMQMAKDLAGKVNPWAFVPNPWQVKVDAADAAAYLEDQLDDDDTWIQVSKVDGKMKTVHIGPGDTAFTGGTQGNPCFYITWVDLDAKGHVRQFQYISGLGPPLEYTTVGPVV